MTNTRYSGFNLVETIVASMILSGSVLALGAISTRGLTDTQLNRHEEIAASVIDKQLTLIDAMGIDQFVDQGQTEGMIQELEPGYTWAVSTEYQGIDNVYLVTVTVQWLERNRPRQLAAQTMLNGAGMITTPATQTQER